MVFGCGPADLIPIQSTTDYTFGIYSQFERPVLIAEERLTNRTESCHKRDVHVSQSDHRSYKSIGHFTINERCVQTFYKH